MFRFVFIVNFLFQINVSVIFLLQMDVSFCDIAHIDHVISYQCVLSIFQLVRSHD